MNTPPLVMHAMINSIPELSYETKIIQVEGKMKDILTGDKQHIHYIPKDFQIEDLGAYPSDDYYQKSVAQAKLYATMEMVNFWAAYHETYNLLFWGYA